MTLRPFPCTKELRKLANKIAAGEKPVNAFFFITYSKQGNGQDRFKKAIHISSKIN